MSQTVFPKLRGVAWPVTVQPFFNTIVQDAASGQEVRIPLWPTPRKKFTMQFDYLSAGLSDPLPWSQDDIHNLQGLQMNVLGKWDTFLYHHPTDSVTQAAPCINTVTGLTVGDGSTATFQLQRSYGAAAEPVYDLNANGVNSVVVTNGGTGYKSATVVFSGTGTGAKGYAIVAAGSVTAIVLASSGRDYTIAPTVTIVGDGTSAAATAYLTPRVYIGGVYQSSGYSIGSTGIITFASAPGSNVSVVADCAYYWRCRFDEDSLEFEQFMGSYFSLKTCVLYQVHK